MAYGYDGPQRPPTTPGLGLKGNLGKGGGMLPPNPKNQNDDMWAKILKMYQDQLGTNQGMYDSMLLKLTDLQKLYDPTLGQKQYADQMAMLGDVKKQPRNVMSFYSDQNYGY